MNAAVLPRLLLDTVLPPRCAGCGEIVGRVGDFCAPCFGGIDWANEAGCVRCALPLEATDERVCAGCQLDPGAIEATMAATHYGELTRSLVMRLKYGRRVGLARTMATAMARCLPESNEDRLLVPVPLHRWRIWKRGFNQAALLANELSRRTGLPVALEGLERRKSTRPLKAMSGKARARTVRGAFVADKELVAGRTIVLVDDVRTSGSTLEECAKALRRAGAARVEALVWARVTASRG